MEMFNKTQTVSTKSWQYSNEICVTTDVGSYESPISLFASTIKDCQAVWQGVDMDFAGHIGFSADLLEL